MTIDIIDAPPIETDWFEYDPGVNGSDWSSQARLASQLWSSVGSAARLALWREWGSERAAGLEFGLMRRQQATYFLNGVDKLGIIDESDQVVAAKYHVLSNLLAGQDMAYREDDRGRAWVFRMPPNSWSANPMSPCPEFVQIPTAIRVAGMHGWEGNNGVLLGNHRLRWTVTELQSCDGPYDAGYFDIAPTSCRRGESVRVLLDSDRAVPGPSPLLGLGAWPAERRNQALIKASARHALTSLGQAAAHSTMAEAAAFARLGVLHVFSSWARTLLSEFGIREPNSVSRSAWLFRECLALLGDDITLHQDGSGFTLDHRWSRLAIPEYPGWETLPVEIERAFAQAWQVISRQLGDEVRIEVARSRSQGAETTLWTFERAL